MFLRAKPFRNADTRGITTYRHGDGVRVKIFTSLGPPYALLRVWLSASPLLAPACGFL